MKNYLITFILLVSFFTYLAGQEAKAAQPGKQTFTQDPDREPFKCSQRADEQEPLIREAAKNQYTIIWVVFSGNEHTRDRVLRRRVMLQAGDVFTRENLVKSLKSLSQLKKIIYPVNLSDVIISLDRPEKIINMTICFKEKRR